MTLDFLAVAVAFFSFGVFLLVNFITFRWVRPEHLLRSLLICVVAIMACPLALMGIFYLVRLIDVSPYAWMAASFLALSIQGLLCFFYVLCLFGPYETSIRMRLVREIARPGSQGLSLKELLERYNVETMVNLRLARLLGSGDIVCKNGLYQVGRGRNFFFVFDAIAAVIKKWIDG